MWRAAWSDIVIMLTTIVAAAGPRHTWRQIHGLRLNPYVPCSVIAACQADFEELVAAAMLVSWVYSDLAAIAAKLVMAYSVRTAMVFTQLCGYGYAYRTAAFATVHVDAHACKHVYQQHQSGRHFYEHILLHFQAAKIRNFDDASKFRKLPRLIA